MVKLNADRSFGAAFVKVSNGGVHLPKAKLKKSFGPNRTPAPVKKSG